MIKDPNQWFAEYKRRLASTKEEVRLWKMQVSSLEAKKELSQNERERLKLILQIHRLRRLINQLDK